jgi:hypothetical protein
VIGGDFRLSQKFWTGPRGWHDWTGFEQPPGVVAGPPSIVWTGASRLDVFVHNKTEGAKYQKVWTAATGWQAWLNM